jgi:TolB-like protein/Tfp pilus assembly protein PilF
LLWARTGDERARHNLRQALSSIRQCCGPVINSLGDRLQIDLQQCNADILEFENLFGSDDPQKLRNCLGLYRGQLLDGLDTRENAYADWLLPVRTRFRIQACQAAERLGQYLVKQGRSNDAIGVFNELLSIEPIHETAHRELMRLYSDSGRRAEALRQFQTCEAVLQRELGVMPGHETRDLLEQINLSTDSVSLVKDRVDAKGAELRSATKLPTVAVLPFKNLSETQDTYFADGITEDLTTALSCFHSLEVISRGSSFLFRESTMTDEDIAQNLGAQYLVRGSVQRSRNRVRVNVRLLDTERGLHLWGHRYDREMEDVFMLQDEITSTLVSTLAGRVEADRLARARKAPSERLDAYDFLLRGKDHHHRFTAEDCGICINMFEKAIEHDSSYAVAYAWLACGLGQAMVFELDDMPTLVEKCEQAANKGLELDANDGECHRILAQVSITNGDISRALQHQERALFLNPNDDRIVNAMGEVLVFVGRQEEAESWVRKSMQLNPCYPQRYLTHLVRAQFHQQKAADALQTLKHIEKPRSDDLTYGMAAASVLGRTDEYRGFQRLLNQQYPDFDPVQFARSLPFRQTSDRLELERCLTMTSKHGD